MADSQEDNYYSSLGKNEQGLEMDTYYTDTEIVPENNHPPRQRMETLTSQCGPQKHRKIAAIAGVIGLTSGLLIGIPSGFCMRQSGECPKLWTKFSSSCYRLWEEEHIWSEAEFRCQQEGGHLVSILSKQENEFINNTFFNQKNIWIGANDKLVEGLWTWSDGYPMEFEDWNEGQPNESGDQDCGVLDTSFAGRWSDVSCSTPRAFLCKAL
eukprot:GFUD01100354.1.p1 GENE.GFUD01100354.1~~GFUD01100354.1.p1  ORF type:complete len:211 (-),score=33.55 GFUD01100354.1:201-833(-)